MKKSKLLADPAAARKKSGANQSAFWKKFGVTQSGGSRYENGRGIPLPTRILMALHEAGKISDQDLEAALKSVGK